MKCYGTGTCRLKQKLKVNMAVPHLAFSVITSSSKHEHAHRKRMCVRISAVRLSLRSNEHFPSTKPWFSPPLFSQDKHFQLVSQTLQMRFNGCHRLCLSLCFSPSLFPSFFFSQWLFLVSWDRGAMETRPRLAHWDRKKPNYSSEKLLLHFNSTIDTIQQSYVQLDWFGRLKLHD